MLRGGGGSPLLWFQTYQQSQRSLLLQGQESLSSATQSIERSQRIATETDQIGSEIIEELGGQREQLERSRNRVSVPLSPGGFPRRVGVVEAILRRV